MQSLNRATTIFRRLLSSDGLRAKAMRGGVWLGLWGVAEQGIRFTRNMLLARILAPEAFGTMAIVLSSASLIDTLSEVGHKAAIIQNPRGASDAHLNAGWWLGLVRAVFVYLLIFTSAPLIAGFYRRPELAALLRVALLGILLNSLMSPRSILGMKDLKFAHWAAIMNGGGICGVLLTVLLGSLMHNVWALAIGYSGEQAFRCVLSYIFFPGLPSRKCDWQAARELLTFSRGIVGMPFLNIIIARADIFVLAKLYSSASLGVYTMAVSLVTTPLGFLTGILSQALVPALARIQDDTVRLNRVVLEVTSWFVFLGLPGAVTICLCAPYLLQVAYGSRYLAAAGPLSLAAIVVFIAVLHAVTTCLLFAKGRPALHRQASAATAVTMVVAIYPACRYLGPIGGQVAAMVAALVGYLFQLERVHSLFDLKLAAYRRAFVTPMFGTAALLGVVLACRRFGFVTSPVAYVALCVGSCLMVYAVSARAFLRNLRPNAFAPAQVPDPACLPGRAHGA